MNYQLYTLRMIAVVVCTMLCVKVSGQAPTWQYSGNYANTMSIVLSVSDECQPSADPNDIIGAFDVNGEVRGVAQTNIGNEAFLTIGGNSNGETIILKVYDASSDAIYTIHTYQVNFSSGARLGPLVGNFDSDPQSAAGGPDQLVVDVETTNMAATDVGTWSLISGDGGTIADPSNPNTAFTGVIGTTYLLAWTLSETEGCIGETDEVSVTFDISMAEDTPERCSDGFDNDNNGLLDCQEASCGKVSLTNISKTDPTALTCTTETSDGEIVISHTGATSFSLDGGVSVQAASTFSGLPVGDYTVLLQNDFAGCSTSGTISLINTLNSAPPVAAFAIDGPAIICAGNNAVSFDVDKPLNGSIEWNYSGMDVIITPSGVSGSIDFGDDVTAGVLSAVMSNTCSSNMATLPITIASPFLCNNFTNCTPVVNVTSALLENANISHVFQASDTLNSTAQLMNNDYEFTAGESIQFGAEFSVDQGLSFIANIKNCNN